MNSEAVFTFRNTHHAIDGERALLEAGLDVRVMGRPASLGTGCGICLRVNEGLYPQARTTLEGAGVEIEAVYRRIAALSGTVYQPIEE